ncbi:MAG TPA: hypothetical protein VGS07_30080 [Thermoanaerobaculia bacterium]|nr:hypothetical protein [Thermoanaerobaculia bacterium]
MAKKKNEDGTTKRTRFTRRGERSKVWRQVATSAAAHAVDLPGSEVQRGDLEKVIVEVDKIVSEQGAFQANKQVASQRLRTLVSQGDKLTTVLKTIAKERYGHGSDKLVEFGIQPLRSRPKPTVVPPTTPAPELGTPGSTPPTTPPGNK